MSTSIFGDLRMTNTELDEAIASQPYDKVTKELIESRIVDVSYMLLPDSTVTICNIVLQNGYSVRGEAACVDAGNFNMQIGRELAYRDAFRKLWPLEGYLLAERQWQGRQTKPVSQDVS